MTPVEKAIGLIGGLSDPNQLRTMLQNARGKAPEVERAAFERLIHVLAGKESGDALAQDLWRMIFAVEEIRRIAGRKLWRMNRLRPMVETQGAQAAFEKLALKKSEGFDEVLGNGRVDLLAESIAMRHSHRLSEEAILAAKTRLQEHGLPVQQGPI